MQYVVFLYLNHRGETSLRKVTPDALEFQRNPGYGYQPGWFLSGHDHDKNARRSFALSRIISSEENASKHNLIQLPLSANKD